MPRIALPEGASVHCIVDDFCGRGDRRGDLGPRERAGQRKFWSDAISENAQRPARRKCACRRNRQRCEVVRIRKLPRSAAREPRQPRGRLETGPAGQPFLNGCPGRPATFTRML
jgi:hypothetical protein